MIQILKCGAEELTSSKKNTSAAGLFRGGLGGLFSGCADGRDTDGQHQPPDSEASPSLKKHLHPFVFVVPT